MKNRAKCKLCDSVIESFHSTDYVFCKCGEISVDGGEALRCYAKNWENFMRVDDAGNEFFPKIVESEEENPTEQGLGEPEEPPNMDDLMREIDLMILNIERLPDHAKYSPVTQQDHWSLLVVLSSILRAK